MMPVWLRATEKTALNPSILRAVLLIKTKKIASRTLAKYVSPSLAITNVLKGQFPKLQKKSKISPPAIALSKPQRRSDPRPLSFKSVWAHKYVCVYCSPGRLKMYSNKVPSPECCLS
uniref:Uncharacterized protein n=1 Tax=Sphaerodactylus townsendi TaxID=933632 RepID=A0ACB8E984_9SAUR